MERAVSQIHTDAQTVMELGGIRKHVIIAMPAKGLEIVMALEGSFKSLVVSFTIIH